MPCIHITELLEEKNLQDLSEYYHQKASKSEKMFYCRDCKTMMNRLFRNPEEKKACFCLACLKQRYGDSDKFLWFEQEKGVCFCLKCEKYCVDMIPKEMVFQKSKRARYDLYCIEDEHKYNIRGFNSMGQTCFMNSIIQVLVHNPMVRNYMLGLGQIILSESKISGHYAVGLELQKLIHENGKQGDAITPHRFLYAMWKSAGHLAGYQQHDAHEFFISCLNILKEQSPYCKMIDLVFRGMVESTLACRTCQRKSVTTEPFIDLSLSLSSHVDPSRIYGSLYEALKRYTTPETMETLKCDKCKKHLTKQLTLKQLPMVLSFHLKRFSSNPLKYAKINDFVEFPFEIDMMEFTSSSIHEKQHQVEGTDTVYELFAVVIHAGTLESGHYTSYVIHEKKWYLCNDSLVTEHSPESVLSSHAYMLFYIKKNLVYE